MGVAAGADLVAGVAEAGLAVRCVGAASSSSGAEVVGAARTGSSSARGSSLCRIVARRPVPWASSCALMAPIATRNPTSPITRMARAVPRRLIRRSSRSSGARMAWPTAETAMATRTAPTRVLRLSTREVSTAPAAVASPVAAILAMYAVGSGADVVVFTAVTESVLRCIAEIQVPGWAAKHECAIALPKHDQVLGNAAERNRTDLHWPWRVHRHHLPLQRRSLSVAHVWDAHLGRGSDREAALVHPIARRACVRLAPLGPPAQPGRAVLKYPEPRIPPLPHANDWGDRRPDDPPGPGSTGYVPVMVFLTVVDPSS